MKTLYIVRHAKSSWEHAGLADYERPLINKGVRKTEKVAAYLLENNIKPGLMISSHAVRAYETARIIAAQLNYREEDIRISEELYHSSSDQVFDVLFDVDDRIDSVMIFGHNPTFTSFANNFLNMPIDWLPTSGIVAVSFDTDEWTRLPMAKSKTEFVIYPKDL